MAEELMALVKELKQLNARKKAGEALPPDQEQRRKALKRHLKAVLEQEQGGATSTAAASGAPAPTPPRAPSAPLPSAGRPTSSVAAPPTPQPASAPAPTAPKPATTSGPKKNPFAIDASALLGKAAESAGDDDDAPFATSEVDDPDLLADLEAPTPKAAAPKPGTASGPKKNPFAIDAGALLGKAAESTDDDDDAPFATSEVDDPDLTMDFDEEAPPAPPAPTPRSAAAAVLVTEPPPSRPQPPSSPPVATPATPPTPPPAPAPSPAAPAKKSYANAFMLDAGALFEQAESSAAVAAAAPPPSPGPGGGPLRTAGRGQGSLDVNEFQRFVEGDGAQGMRNSAAAIAEAAARADRALEQTKTRERVTKPDEVAQQLSDILGGSGYTRPEAHLALEQYYGEYMDSEGLSLVEGGQMGVKLQIIDPREVDLYRSGLLSDGSEQEAAAVPTGLAFLDDFGALYQLGILPPVDHEVQFDVDDPNLIIPGKRKVTVHLLNGQVKRGAIRKLARDDLGFRLEPQGTGRAEELSLQQCKAIFVHLPPNAQPKQAAGRPLTVTFADRRSIQGTSDDYQPGLSMFSLIPPANPRQGQFERIIVNAAAVQQLR